MQVDELLKLMEDKGASDLHLMVSSPPDLKYLPWEDESQEDFEKRAKSYGLNLNTEVNPNNRHFD